jgi:hypothetical protein
MMKTVFWKGQVVPVFFPQGISADAYTGRVSVLDRLQRAQMPDWESRNAIEIAELLRAAGHQIGPEVTSCFGSDHPIPGSLHRAGQIQNGEFKGFRIFARAYLGELLVPAYGRSPQDVLPQVAEHCLR